MSRCIICDYCTTQDSLYKPFEFGGSNSVVDTPEGPTCTECLEVIRSTNREWYINEYKGSDSRKLILKEFDYDESSGI